MTIGLLQKTKKFPSPWTSSLPLPIPNTNWPRPPTRACAWRRDGTCPRHLIVRGWLRIQGRQRLALPANVPGVADLYVYNVGFRDLSGTVAMSMGITKGRRKGVRTSTGQVDSQSGKAWWGESTTDDSQVYEPTLKETGLDREPCAVRRSRTVGRHIRGIDKEALTHLDKVLLPRLVRVRPPETEPVLLALREAAMQGRMRLKSER